MKRKSLSALKAKAAGRPAGYVEDVLSRASEVTHAHYTISDEAWSELVTKYRAGSQQKLAGGAGTELNKLIGRIGIKLKTNCKCLAHAGRMDREGIAWCEQNIDTIIGWLREEATKRKLPFVELAARLLVKLAIRRAKKMT